MQKIGFLFPGQGSQIVGMSKQLCEEFSLAQEIFQEANDVLGFDLASLCFEGELDELTKTENTQPALLTASVAAYRVFMEEIGIKPLITAGHSLGEFSALTCSNVMDFSQALKIVRKRGMLMQEANQSGQGRMLAVSGLNSQVLNEECKLISTEEMPVVIACYNSPQQNVISGNISSVEKLTVRLQKIGATVHPVKVSAAFHSPMMLEAAKKFRSELEKYSYRDPEWEVLSNVNALPYKSSKEMVDLLTRQMTEPVLWQDSMQYMKEKGINTAFEFGPRTVLKKLMEHYTDTVKVLPLENQSHVDEIHRRIHSKEKEFRFELISRCITTAISTKNSNWNSHEYREGVIEPYRKVKGNFEIFQNQCKSPTDDQVFEAFEMLNTVLETKGVLDGERVQVISRLLADTKALSIFPELIKFIEVINKKESNIL